MGTGTTTIDGITICRRSLETKSLADIADLMSRVTPDSDAFGIIKAEMERRQTDAVIATAKAQKDAAFYMLLSFGAVLAASLVVAGAAIWQAACR